MKVVLFLISIILAVLLFPIGFIYSLIFKFKKAGNYLFKIALCVDQSGNVVMRDLFDLILISKDSKHKFGNEDDTISYVLGMNFVEDTLTHVGFILVQILDILDKNHVIKAINNK